MPWSTIADFRLILRPGLLLQDILVITTFKTKIVR